MGQQQLLLVILVTIIVGIATVVAINIFGTAAEQANQDAVRQDLLAAAAQAQGIHARPVMMGGSGGDFGSSALPDQNFSERLGIPGTVNELVITNENAIYTISERSGNDLTISADPTGSPGTWSLELSQNSDGEWITTITDNDGLQTTIGDASGSGGSGT